MASKKVKPISLRAYARHRGVSAEAVSKAVKEDRLVESVVMVDGKPKIFDIELADLEWKSNTRPRVGYGASDEEEDGAAPDETGLPSYEQSVRLRAMHAARREGALADIAEIDVAEKREELVPVAEARRFMADKFTTAKTKILGVPTRVAQRLPDLADRVVPVVKELVREVLVELAVEEDDGDDADEQ